MVRVTAAALVAVALLVAIDASSRAARRDWVGSETCGSCHPAQLAGWRKTAHARATDRLGAKPRGRCLACHATGDAPAGKAYFLEVGCEACHGAGGHYAEDDVMRDKALAEALGLRDVSTDAVCQGCHNPTRGTGTRLAPLDMTFDASSVH